MFTDMSLSADLNLAFKTQEGDIKGNASFLISHLNFRKLNTRVLLGFEMLVLTSGAWPLNQSMAGEFKVPEEVNMSVKWHFLKHDDVDPLFCLVGQKYIQI